MNSLWLDIIMPVLSIIIPVFATIYTVNNRIKNENKESHKPYIVLNSIEAVDKIDIYAYYLIIIGKKCEFDIENIDSDKISDDNVINVKLVLQNIGYGVASNIKFYDLNNSKEIYGTQSNNLEQNQKLYTTLDLADGDTKKIQAKIIYVDFAKEEQNQILCVYQDLNHNTYNFIISINIKSKGHYNFFAYQPASRSYKKVFNKAKKSIEKIIEKYNKI